jgi:uncharacterized damage-inducible protein DinB
MKTVTLAMLALLAGSAVMPDSAAAQSDPLSTQNRYLHQGMTMLLLQSAERMPAESYDFRPVSTVRSYAQILGHIADMHYLHCSILRGERNPAPRVEATASRKPDVIVALKGALSYCDPAFAAMTDSTGMTMVTFSGGRLTRLSLLTVHHMHNSLHYGNLVTYLRMKGVVPPTSDPTLMPPTGGR